ncbi:hypothetical protein [Actinomadura rubrisoli]|uniref:hypothetical protein n=1 Tax=Actinomadura rubrisoli TaxID=2530368 RepID=UPI00140431DF|nr:hypothetical protein [Actinomadura rubrisoli]
MTFATFYPEGDGWWRASTRRGVRELWVRQETPEPWREIVERLPAHRAGTARPRH